MYRRADELSRSIGVGVGVMLLAAGCARRIELPDFGELYSRAAEFEGVERNPVVVIPGLLGSTLRQTESERAVWGLFRGNYADPSEPDGARLFSLPMRAGVPLDELTDDVYAAGALDSIRLTLLGLPIVSGAYAQILGTLGVGGYRDEELGLAGAVHYGDEHFTCFQFPYDWRRDISENAVRFHAFLEQKAVYVREQYQVRYGIDRGPVQFDVVAHSMGGLLLRYYLRFGGQALPEDGSVPEVTWAGTQAIDRSVLIATPNAGAITAMRELLHGKRFAFFLPKYQAAMLGTFPSMYQLLPRVRHGAYVDGESSGTKVVDSALEPATWERHGWGLADPEQALHLETLLPDVESAEERRAIALEHLAKCLRRADQFQRAMDQAAPEGAPEDLSLVVGDSVPTLALASIDMGSGAVEFVETSAGDGTVLRSSALLDERLGGQWSAHLLSPIHWKRVLFLFDDHLGLTRNPAFVDNVLYWLLEEPRYTQASPGTTTDGTR